MRYFSPFVESFERHATSAYLIDARRERTWTHAEFLSRAFDLAEALAERGLSRGDRLVAIVENSPELAALYFANLILGTTIIPVSPTLHAAEIDYIVEESRASLAAISAHLPPVRGVTQRWTPDRILRVGSHDASAGVRADWSMGDDPHLRVEPPRDLQVSQEDLWTITFTSGTTSRPKGVAHRVSSLLQSARSFAAAVDYTERTRLLHVLPMTYMAGFLNTLLCPWVVGGSVVLDRPFDARSALDFWSVPENHGVNRLCLVPTILAMLMQLDRSDRGPKFCRANVDAISVCTAPLPQAVKLAFEERYGTTLLESYGLSETLFATTERPGWTSKLGSVGSAIEGVSVEVRDDAGDPIATGATGEIFLRAATLMEGYLREGVADADTAPEWFPTGDVGYIDRQGDLFITARKKDLIIRGGVNISPRAVEEVLLEHSSVRGVAVIGAPHAILGEEIVAVIETAAGSSWEPLSAELKQLCRERLADAAQPARFVPIDELPRGSTGKILKTSLRDMIGRLLTLEATP